MSKPQYSPFGSGGKAAETAAETAVSDNETKADAAYAAAKAAHDAAQAASDVAYAADVAASDLELEEFVNDFSQMHLENRNLDIDELGRNPSTWPYSKSFLYKHVGKKEPTNGLSKIPIEVVSEIASNLGVQDLNNMRLVSSDLNMKVMFQYGKKSSVTDNVTIFPTFASLAAFLVGLRVDDAYARSVRTITLVGEGPKTPKLSYDISWAHLYMATTIDWSGITYAQKTSDVEILDYVNDQHADWDWVNKPFCHTGGYRTMLSILLPKLPNLRTIETRKLHLGENIPGWTGTEYLQELSFFRPDLRINEIYYGDWVYDEKHKRVTMYTDEYGEDIVEDNPGPQVGFMEDLVAAMAISGTNAQIVQ